MKIAKFLLSFIIVFVALLLVTRTISAHNTSKTEYATCRGYLVKGEYHGGSQRRRVVWSVDVKVDGITTHYEGDWRGIDNGFTLFEEDGNRADVETSGYIKLYDCQTQWYKKDGVWECKKDNWKKLDHEQFDLHFSKSFCVKPTPTPACTPEPTATPEATPQSTATPEPTPEVTPEPSVTPQPTTPSTNTTEEKHTSMVLTDPTCENNNMDASITLTKYGQPVQGVNVKFIYENEAKFAKTESNGRAGVLFGYKKQTEVVIEPEDGYPAQRQKPSELKNCQIAAAPQVLGLADAGVFDDMIANIAGVFGTLSTTIGTILYAKKKTAKTKKSSKK